MTELSILNGILVDEDVELSLLELSQMSGRPVEWVLELVAEGIIEPMVDQDAAQQQAYWRFHGACLRRVRIVQRLESDLGINLAGAALAIELLEEVAALRLRQADAS